MAFIILKDLSSMELVTRVRRRGRHLAVGSEMMTESLVMQENEEAHPDSNYIS